MEAPAVSRAPPVWEAGRADSAAAAGAAGRHQRRWDWRDRRIRRRRRRRGRRALFRVTAATADSAAGAGAGPAAVFRGFRRLRRRQRHARRSSNMDTGGGGGAGMGGAIFNEAGTVVITNSTFTANTASGGAGGTVPLQRVPAARGWAAGCSTTTAHHGHQQHPLRQHGGPGGRGSSISAMVDRTTTGLDQPRVFPYSILGQSERATTRHRLRRRKHQWRHAPVISRLQRQPDGAKPGGTFPPIGGVIGSPTTPTTYCWVSPQPAQWRADADHGPAFRQSPPSTPAASPRSAPLRPRRTTRH